MEKLKKSRGERLRLLKGNLTDKQFAERFGQPWTTMRKWLTGENSPREEQVWQQIADSYNVPLLWLMWGTLPTSEQFDEQQLQRLFACDPTLAGTITRNGKTIPVINALKNQHQVCFFCIHCNMYHYHGADDDEHDQSPRLSHCIAINSPYKKNGYILHVIGEMQKQNDKFTRPPTCRNCGKHYSAAFRVCSCGTTFRVDSNNPYSEMSEIYRNIYFGDSSLEHPDVAQQIESEISSKTESMFDASLCGWFNNMKKWVIQEYGDDNDSAQEFIEQFKIRFPEYRNWLACSANRRSSDKRTATTNGGNEMTMTMTDPTRTVFCPACTTEVSRNAETCPCCGEPIRGNPAVRRHGPLILHSGFCAP